MILYFIVFYFFALFVLCISWIQGYLDHAIVSFGYKPDVIVLLSVCFCESVGFDFI